MPLLEGRRIGVRHGTLREAHAVRRCAVGSIDEPACHASPHEDLQIHDCLQFEGCDGTRREAQQVAVLDADPFLRLGLDDDVVFRVAQDDFSQLDRDEVL